MSDDIDFLSGITVVEAGSGVAVSYAGLLLTDAGARVIKVEPPSGDPLRAEPPLTDAGSAVFQSLNRGKQSVCIDLTNPRGQAALDRLLAATDAVIHHLPAGERATIDRIVAGHGGRVVNCVVSAYGERGPLRDREGAEAVIQGMANYFSSLGQLGEPPVRIGADIAGMNTGVFAAIAVVTGLLEREDTGQGARAVVDMLGTLVHLRSVMWGALSDPDEWWGFHLDSEAKPPDHGWNTADGSIWFNLHRGSSEDWDRLLIELDMLDAYDDPRFANNGRDSSGTGRYAHAVKPRWEAAFASRTSDDVLRLLGSVGANAVPMNDYPSVFAHPHTRALGIGSLRLSSGLPAIMSPFVGDIEPSAAAVQPRLQVAGLGEHTTAVLEEAGLTPDDIARLRDAAVVA